jgi:hypothetical protein
MNTYVNKEYNFSIQYPSDWTIIDGMALVDDFLLNFVINKLSINLTVFSPTNSFLYDKDYLIIHILDIVFDNYNKDLKGPKEKYNIDKIEGYKQTVDKMAFIILPIQPSLTMEIICYNGTLNHNKKRLLENIISSIKFLNVR